MGYVAARAQAGLGAGYQEDWVLVGLNAGAAVGKSLWYLKDKIKFIENGLKQKGPVKGPTIIVDLAIVALGVMDLMNGVLAPHRGEAFTTGKNEFDSTLLNLKLAKADPAKWSGEGADAYAAANAALTELVKQMQDLDKQMQSHLADHAQTVAKVHQVIAACLLALVIAQGAALVLWSIPVVGPKISVIFQAVSVAATGGTTLVYEGIVLHSSAYKSALIDTMAGDYTAVAEKAPIKGSFAKIGVLGADETKVSSFKAISDGMSSMATVSGMPTVNALLSRGSATLSADEREIISTLTGSDDGFAAAASAATTPEVPEAPEDKTPTAPAVTPPTLGQLSQASGQFAKMSQTISQPVNQTMQQVQQIASMAQQGQGAAAPAETAATEAAPAEEAALAGDVEGAAAGTGTEGTERAPVDAAVAGTQQTPQPGRAERLV